jgi:hypothetical protein
MTATPNAADCLKHAAAIARECIEWTTDAIGGSSCDHDGHEIETNAISDLAGDLVEIAAPFGDLNRYSDGRLVRSVAWIVEGELSTARIWHPDITADGPRSWRGHLPSDPGSPSPGVYEVATDPVAQEILVRVVRTARGPEAVAADPDADAPF